MKKNILHTIALLSWAIMICGGQECPEPSNTNTNFCDGTNQIETWEEFATAMKGLRDGDVKVFCPFHIMKTSSSALLIEDEITIICQEAGKCILDHTANVFGRRFFKIRGKNAQFTASGFVFQNAGDRSSGTSLTSAVHIGFFAGNGATQRFCNCDFIG